MEVQTTNLNSFLIASCSCSKVVLGSRFRLADLPSERVSLIFLLAGLLPGEWEGPLWEELLGVVSVGGLCIGVGETLVPCGVWMQCRDTTVFEERVKMRGERERRGKKKLREWEGKRKGGREGGGGREREREREREVLVTHTLLSFLCCEVALADWLWFCCFCCCCCCCKVFLCWSLACSSTLRRILLSVSLMVSSSLWRVLDFWPVAIIFEAGREYSSVEVYAL